MEDIYINIDGWRVYGKTAGSTTNPLILGIHGWSQRNGWHTWQPLMAPLAAAGFWVISVDMPGWGKTAATTQAATDTEPATQVLAMVAALAAKTAVLMGKSWGGAVALEAALQAPEIISKLILTAPARRNFDPLRQLTQPVLLAWAADDQVIPYSWAQKYVQTVPQLQLESYPTGGHSAAQNNVADFAPKAIKFLKSS